MNTPTIVEDDGAERELPFTWQICNCCDGHGKSSAYLGAFTGEQMREDPDFAEAYMAGYYDRACDTCDGSGKVKVADTKRMSPADRKEYRKQQADLAESYRIERQERMYEQAERAAGC